MRDLGGYRGTDGKVTAWERLFRSDTPLGLAEGDIRWLLDRNVTTIIDLRSPEETREVPNQLAHHIDFRYYHCPLLGGEVTPAREEDVGRNYFETLDRRISVASVMRLIANAPGGVLYHCMAGKDRTGMISMLLLTLSGVSEEDVLADYQSSEIYLADMVRELEEIRTDLPYYAGWSRWTYMQTCMALLREKYGSIPDYLKATGLTDDELNALRGKLLTKGESH